MLRHDAWGLFFFLWFHAAHGIVFDLRGLRLTYGYPCIGLLSLSALVITFDDRRMNEQKL